MNDLRRRVPFASLRNALLAAVLALAGAIPGIASAIDGAPLLGKAPQRFESQDITGWALRPKAALTRDAVAQLYKNVYVPGNSVALVWTGSIAGCNPGTTNLPHQQAVIDRINYARTLVGLPSVTLLGGTPVTQVQAGALIMSANNALSHFPPTNWTCYSTDGAAGAGSSNIAIGSNGVGAVDLYLDDPGTGNEFTGHRRWILFPPRAQMATGDVSKSGSAAGNPYCPPFANCDANNLYVFGPQTTRPTTPDGIAWPPAGFVPWQNLPDGSNRWSWSFPGANFAAATVTMSGPAGNIPVTVGSRTDNGYGDNTIVFSPTGVPYSRPAADTTYTVTISGITGTGVPPSIQYTVTVIDPDAVTPPGLALTLTPAAFAFGSIAVGQTSGTTLTLSNPGTTPALLQAPTTTGDFAINAGTTTCGGTLAGGTSCNYGLRFAPTAFGARTGAVSIASNAPGSPNTASFTGTGLVSSDYNANLGAVVTGYYETILGRSPDAGGKVFWLGEVSRMSGLGASVSDVLYVMALQFFASPEYLGRNTSDTQYLTDQYRTFFVRNPDAGGLAFWQSQLAQGKTRGAVLNDFLFSPEFRTYISGIFGTAVSRAEVAMVLDYYRGLLSRLPDTAGFNNWNSQFRTAQCQGASAVSSRANAISQEFIAGGEYAARQAALAAAARNPGYVTDLYNAFLKRGGDLTGFNFWVTQLNNSAQTRDQVRLAFLASPEFQTRVNAVIAQGCLSP